MQKRIIICGPAGAGKDYLKKKFGERGFKLDVSYTTRYKREEEKYGVDYNFISKDEFTLRISNGGFYEYCKHGDYSYGTGQYEWDSYDVFIMETLGISKITPEDRENCFIIYLNPPSHIRAERLKKLRSWDEETLAHRNNMDIGKFKNFIDFDIEIKTPYF